MVPQEMHQQLERLFGSWRYIFRFLLQGKWLTLYNGEDYNVFIFLDLQRWKRRVSSPIKFKLENCRTFNSIWTNNDSSSKILQYFKGGCTFFLGHMGSTPFAFWSGFIDFFVVVANLSVFFLLNSRNIIPKRSWRRNCFKQLNKKTNLNQLEATTNRRATWCAYVEELQQVVRKSAYLRGS